MSRTDREQIRLTISENLERIRSDLQFSDIGIGATARKNMIHSGAALADDDFYLGDILKRLVENQELLLALLDEENEALQTEGG